MSERRAEIVKQLRAERDELYLQVRQIDDALVALGALNAKDQNTNPRTDERMTLQGRIRILLEEQDKAWNAAAVVEALQAEGFVGLNSDDPVPGVRTSFVRLKSKGFIDKTVKGFYKATKWLDPLDDYDDYEPSDEELAEMVLEHKARAYDPAEEPF